MISYSFSRFRLDPGRRKLFDREVEIAIGDRAFDVLVVLLEARPTIVSKEAIIEHVWRGTAVEDNSVERAIVAIRKALDDDARDPKFIKTVRGRGYHFVVDVEVAAELEAVGHSLFAVRGSAGIRSWVAGGIAAVSLIAAGAIWASSGYIAALGTKTLFVDDFVGRELSPEKWIVEGKRVRIVEGVARVSVDEVDNGGVLRSRPIEIDPTLPLSVKSRVKVTFNQSVDMNIDFVAAFGIRVGGASEFIGVKYANAEGEFCYPENTVKAEGIYLVRGDADVRKNKDHVSGLVGPRLEPAWDIWVEQELRYDPRSEMLTYLIAGVKKAEFAIGTIPLDGTRTVQVEVYPRGWWLHHAIEIDQITVSQIQL